MIQIGRRQPLAAACACLLVAFLISCKASDQAAVSEQQKDSVAKATKPEGPHCTEIDDLMDELKEMGADPVGILRSELHRLRQTKPSVQKEQDLLASKELLTGHAAQQMVLIGDAHAADDAVHAADIKASDSKVVPVVGVAAAEAGEPAKAELAADAAAAAIAAATNLKSATLENGADQVHATIHETAAQFGDAAKQVQVDLHENINILPDTHEGHQSHEVHLPSSDQHLEQHSSDGHHEPEHDEAHNDGHQVEEHHYYEEDHNHDEGKHTEHKYEDEHHKHEGHQQHGHSGHVAAGHESSTGHVDEHHLAHSGGEHPTHEEHHLETITTSSPLAAQGHSQQSQSHNQLDSHHSGHHHQRQHLASGHSVAQPDEDFENTYIDYSDPSNPEKVHVRRKSRTEVRPDGSRQEHFESSSSQTLGDNPYHFHSSSSSMQSSSSSSSGDFHTGTSFGADGVKHFNPDRKMAKHYKRLSKKMNKLNAAARSPWAPMPPMPPMPPMLPYAVLPYGLAVPSPQWDPYGRRQLPASYATNPYGASAFAGAAAGHGAAFASAHSYGSPFMRGTGNSFHSATARLPKSKRSKRRRSQENDHFDH